MANSTNRFRRLGAVLALATAVGTVAVPTAGANHQDVGPTTALEEIRGTVGAPDAVDRYLRSHPQQTADAACDAVCRYNHHHGVSLITDTLGGNGLGTSFITDTLGGNGSAARSMRSYDTRAYGGASPAVARQIPAAGYGRPTPVASVTVVGGGPSFSWSDAGVGAGVAFAAMLTVGLATLIMRRGRGRLAGF